MDVNNPVIREEGTAALAGTIGARQRRALARLGLAAAGAYVAPTLLTLRSTAAIAMPSADAGIAA
jgi:hypothetical protein